MDTEKLEKRLRTFGQEHLLQFWDRLNRDEQKQLFEDVDSIDFEEMCGNFAKATSQPVSNGVNGGEDDNKKSINDLMEPIDDDLCASVNRSSPEELKFFADVALKEISEGRIGVLLLAGGQGTRLGVPYPKGMYDIGLPSGKTLYQIQVTRKYNSGRRAR